MPAATPVPATTEYSTIGCGEKSVSVVPVVVQVGGLPQIVPAPMLVAATALFADASVRVVPAIEAAPMLTGAADAETTTVVVPVFEAMLTTYDVALRTLTTVVPAAM